MTVSNGEPLYDTAISISPLSIVANTTGWASNLPSAVNDSSAPLAYTGARGNWSNVVSALTYAGKTFNNVYTGNFFDYQSFIGGYTSGNSNYGISHADYKYTPSLDNGTGYIPVVDSPKLSQIDGHNTILTNLPTTKLVNGKFHKGPMYYTDNINHSSRAYM